MFLPLFFGDPIGYLMPHTSNAVSTLIGVGDDTHDRRTFVFRLVSSNVGGARRKSSGTVLGTETRDLDGA
jgi:hypothetical protein